MPLSLFKSYAVNFKSTQPPWYPLEHIFLTDSYKKRFPQFYCAVIQHFSCETRCYFFENVHLISKSAYPLSLKMTRRQTRSMTAAALKKARANSDNTNLTTKSDLTETSPIKRRKLKKTKPVASVAPKEKTPDTDAHVSVILDSPQKSSLNAAELHYPLPTKLVSNLPRIYFGHTAAFPRWITIIDTRQPGEDLGKDLIRTHADQTVISGLRPGSEVNAYDPKVGLAGLEWVLEPGPASAWGGFTRERLERLAHDQLCEALRCPTTCLRLRAMCREQHRDAIANVANPLPPAPQWHLAGPAARGRLADRIQAAGHRLLEDSRSRRDEGLYNRPELGYRSEKNEIQQNGDKYTQMVSIMRRNMKGTLGPPSHQDHSLDPFQLEEGEKTEAKDNLNNLKQESATRSTVPETTVVVIPNTKRVRGKRGLSYASRVAQTWVTKGQPRRLQRS